MATRGFDPIPKRLTPRLAQPTGVSESLTGAPVGTNPYTGPVPALVFDQSGQVRNIGATISALKDNMESLIGTRGDEANRAVLFKDLVVYGILTPEALRSTDGSSSSTGDTVDHSVFAPIDSPVFTGTPIAPTPGTLTRATDSQIATILWVQNRHYAPLDSPVFTGNVKFPHGEITPAGELGLMTNTPGGWGPDTPNALLRMGGVFATTTAPVLLNIECVYRPNVGAGQHNLLAVIPLVEPQYTLLAGENFDLMATAIYPNLGASSTNVRSFVGIGVALIIKAAYTGSVTNLTAIQVDGFNNEPGGGTGTHPVANVRGIVVNQLTTNNNLLTGAAVQTAIWTNGITTSSAGGTITNYGVRVVVPSGGASAGSATNYGIFISGNAGVATGTGVVTNYAFYSLSTAPFFINSNILFGGTTVGFPMLKRVGAELQVRTASDSNYGPISAVTAAPGTNTNQLATTAFVVAGDTFLQGQIDSIAGGGGVGTITGVSAGTGLTGGGTSGGVTLSLIVPVTVALGGTGATTAPAALTSLGAQAFIVAGTTAQYWRGDKAWATLDKAAVGLGNVDNTSDASKPVSTATLTALNLKEDKANKGVASGYASLDVSGKVPAVQLPSYVDDVVEYASLAAFPATGSTGIIYIALDTNRTYRWTGTVYVEISPSPGTTDSLPEGSVNLYFTTARASAAAPVQSVAGRTGTVVLTKTDVGLGNVDNTSDLNKPISTATQTALNLKAPLLDPVFTGDPRAPTPATIDNDTSIATTAFVKAQGYATTGALGSYLPLAGGTLSGGLHFGTVLASGPTDTSKHITLWDTGYGFNITSGTINYVSGGSHTFLAGATVLSTLNAGGYYVSVPTGIRGASNVGVDLSIGTTGGTARVYNSYTDASNGEWAYVGSWAGNVAYFGTGKNGSGQVRNVAITVGGTNMLEYGTAVGNPNAWQMNASLVMGNTTPLYLFYQGFSVNQYYNGGWFYGPNSVNQHGGTFDFDTAASAWRWWSTPTPGNAGPSGGLIIGATMKRNPTTGGMMLTLGDWPDWSANFPMLRRNLTAFEVRLADDSAFAPLRVSTPAAGDNSNLVATTAFITARGNPRITLADTAPVTPAVGDQWWDSVGGQLYLRFNDGTSTQWVPATNAPGPVGPPGATGAPGPAGPAGVYTIGTGLTLNTGTTPSTLSLTVPVAISSGGTGQITASAALIALGGAPLASPVFTGNPTAPTPLTTDNDTSIATTAYVKGQGYVTTGVTDLKEDKANKGIANGYASLDASAKVPALQLPSYVDDVQEFGSISLFPTTGSTGIIYVATDTNKTYRWSGTVYVEISPSPGSTDSLPEGTVNLYYTNARAAAAAPVQSVAGRTGAVVLTKTDVGLGNVDNTTDLLKPVSTATQTALNLKSNLASPIFTGDPQAPTPLTADNDTSIATTAFVKAQGYATTGSLGSYLPLAGGTVSGTLTLTAGPTPLDIGVNSSTTSIRFQNAAAGVGATATPTLELIGVRGDGNATFQSRFGLGFRRSDGTPLDNGYYGLLGTLGFGGQWGTDNTTFQAAKFLYAASINGIAEGAFSAAAAMPTALIFCTGLAGVLLSTVNQTIGTERMRIDSTGLTTVKFGLSFGSQIGGTNIDLSKHISLYGTTYGFNVTSSRINYVVPAAAIHTFMSGATYCATVTATGARTYNGYTDGANYDLAYLGDWSANVARYGTLNAGTFATARDVSFVRGGVEMMKLGAGYTGVYTQLSVTNNTNTLTLSSATATQQSTVMWYDVGVGKWQMGKQTDNSFFLWDIVNVATSFSVSTTGQVTLGESSQIVIPKVGGVSVNTSLTATKLIVNALYGQLNEPSALYARDPVAIGATVGSYLYTGEFNFSAGNNVRLQIAPYRRTAGSAWQGTGFRLQYAVDSSFTTGTGAFVEIGAGAGGAGGIYLSTGGIDRLSIDGSTVSVPSTSTLIISGNTTFTNSAAGLYPIWISGYESSSGTAMLIGTNNGYNGYFGNSWHAINMYWNGSNYVYGGGSSGYYGGLYQFNPVTGTHFWSTTDAAGNAGATTSPVVAVAIRRSAGVSVLAIGTWVDFTASFPAIRANGTSLEVILANQSAYTNLIAGGVLVNSTGFTVQSVVAANTSDLTKHINLWGGSYGFNVTSSRLNYVGATHRFVVAGADIASVTAAGVSVLSNSTTAMLNVGNTAGTIRVYNSYTDVNNGEWAYGPGWTGDVALYGTNQNGTGLARDVRFIRGQSTVMEFNVDGIDVWQGVEHQVRQPVLYGSTALSSTGRGVAVMGNFAYVTNFGLTDSLEIFDISNSAAPVKLSGLSFASQVLSNTVVAGHVLYTGINSITGTVQIIDVSNPDLPVVLSAINTSNACQALALSGNLLFVGQSATAFRIYDVSDPTAPLLKATMVLGGFNGTVGIVLQGKYAYIIGTPLVGGVSGLYIYDVSNPAFPALIINYTTAVLPRGIAISGKYLYICGYTAAAGLHVLDISDPAVPVAVTSVATLGIGLTCPLVIVGDYLYLEYTTGIQIFNISDPANPVSVTSFNLTTSVVQMAVVGNRLYLPGNSQLLVYNTKGLDAHTIRAGSLSTDHLYADGPSYFNGDMYAQRGLVVGPTGVMSRGPITTPLHRFNLNGEIVLNSNAAPQALMTLGGTTNQSIVQWVQATSNSVSTGNHYNVLLRCTHTPSGASALGLYGLYADPFIGAGAVAITTVYGVVAHITVASGNTAVNPTANMFSAFDPTMNGTPAFGSWNGFFVPAITHGTGLTTGSVINRGVHITGITAASAGGAMTNRALSAILPTGGASAGTTQNAGLYLTGNGGVASGSGVVTNFAIFSDSTAESVFGGNIRMTAGAIIQKPAVTQTPVNNGELTFSATSNTSVTMRLKGTDGVVRAVAFTLV